MTSLNSYLFTGLVLATVVAVVTSVQKSVGDNSDSCPSGQKHRPGPVPSVSLCCKTWNYSCPLNYSYSFCTEQGGWDKCRKCPEGFVQPFPTNSDSPMKCYKDRGGCSEEKIALNTTAMKCVCNLANNYYPIALSGCDFKICPTGEHLLINGTCTTCPLGSYKNWSGSGQCLPWTNCEELGQFVFRIGSNVEDVICGLKPEPHPAGSTNTTRPPNPTNDTGADIKVQRGDGNKFGIIGGFVVSGCILLMMMILAFMLRKRACPPKASNDQLYLEMNLRGRTGRHQYEQVQSSDDDLDNSPTSPKIFQISSHSSKGGRQFTYPSGAGNGGYGNLVISSDQENLADELTGLTVNLPDSPQNKPQRPTGVVSPQPREEDDEGGLRTSGGSIPFDSFLRLTPLDSDGHHFVDQGLPPLDLNESQQQQLRQGSVDPRSLTQVKTLENSR
ncbi:uncharacterized protein LOC135475639 [Liolophura sinensis]|uniref:uncharacterized protein LOC135475639 n=1 Tax=Liolophura sinensis TaxID=3198878 RepID=UPI00315848D8